MTGVEPSSFHGDDPLGAIALPILDCPHASSGPLAGLSYMVKDLFDVAGHPTAAGNPDYPKWRGVPHESAWAVETLCRAGARLVGKTHTHELAYGITGVNPHYGTPRNPHAPGRIPGGSSSGSAAVVAGGLVPFALGTDTAGSIRVPASFCGIFGYRPTHGAIPTRGVVPLAPSYDTVGVFAHSAQMLERVTHVLLHARPQPEGNSFHRALLISNALAISEADAVNAARSVVERLKDEGIEIEETELGFLDELVEIQRIIGGAQAWAVHEAWIESEHPKLGRDVARRLDQASRLKVSEIGKALAREADLVHEIESLMDAQTLVVMPAAPGVAPLLDEFKDEQADLAYRRRTFKLTTMASLCGYPVVTVPAAPADALPIGAQLIGPKDSDVRLLALAKVIRSL